MTEQLPAIVIQICTGIGAAFGGWMASRRATVSTGTNIDQLKGAFDAFATEMRNEISRLTTTVAKLDGRVERAERRLGFSPPNGQPAITPPDPQ